VAEEAAILAGARGEFPQRTLAEAVERYRREVTSKRTDTTARADNLRFDAWLRDHPDLAGKVFHQITAMLGCSTSAVPACCERLSSIGLAIKQWKWAGSSPRKESRCRHQAMPVGV
jgi:hypothetical protein